MSPLTAAEIRGSFVNCSRSQAKNIAPPTWLPTVDWDVLDYLGWRDPKAPERGYLVTETATRPVGLVLRAASGASRRGTAMCDLCFSSRRGAEVVLLTAARAGAAGREGNSLGTYVCADLACSLFVRELRPLDLPQGAPADVEERVARLRRRLDGFVARVLGR